MAGDNGEASSKRPWDGRYEDDGAKRSRMSGGGDRPQLRYLIPSTTAGAIIGKGGSRITELRKQYNASIQIPDNRGEERVVITYASNMDDLSALCGEIADAIHSENPHAPEQEVRLLVHKSQAGGIIGTKGAKIKEIREVTGALIKIFQDCCPNSTDRICQIRGDNSMIVHSSKLILEFLETAPPKGPVQPYDPRMLGNSGINEFDGFMQGGGGLHENFGGRNFSNRGHRGRGYSGNQRRGHMPRNNFGGGRGGGNYRGRFNGNNQNNFGGNQRSSFNTASSQGEQGITKVTIPTSLAGCIIGRGGQRISGIRQECGAGITIAEPDPGSEERVITITGTDEQIQNAQFLLQRSVKMYSEKF